MIKRGWIIIATILIIFVVLSTGCVSVEPELEMPEKDIPKYEDNLNTECGDDEEPTFHGHCIKYGIMA